MNTKNRARVLVIGAGEAGELVAREFERKQDSEIVLVGFVDDDPSKQGARIQNIPVIGTIADIPALIRSEEASEVLVSTPSVSGLVSRVTALVPAGFPVRILPSISSVILGKVDLSYIRDIDPSDLIGRSLVKTDQMLIAKAARGKHFLVTGAAGSIGREIVRQLWDSGAAYIIAVDAWEEGVFNIREEFDDKIDAGHPRLITYIGNTRDADRIAEIMDAYPIDVVIHAAAYKHLPLMEENPGEAYKTNVLGTKNVLDAAVTHGIRDFVLISTDKAVRPTSVMGKSKREAELLVQQYAKKHRDRRFCSVRFGNVLNSSGSLVPRLLRQIRTKSEVRITSFEMTRYFMTIPEAVSLVLSAWMIAKNGQTLILDMGKPIKIIDLAFQLIRLHGLEPYVDIAVREVGVRPGEKIHEELTYEEGKVRPSTVARVLIGEEL